MARHADRTPVGRGYERPAHGLGVDEAALGPAALDRVIAMPFVPQPFLFAHGLVDVMLMHGGANTFHEVIVSDIPVLVSPAFGDQGHVALAADRLGVGVCVEAILIPNLAGARSLERAAEEVLPAMLAPGTSRWKETTMGLAARIREPVREDGDTHPWSVHARPPQSSPAALSPVQNTCTVLIHDAEDLRAPADRASQPPEPASA